MAAVDAALSAARPTTPAQALGVVVHCFVRGALCELGGCSAVAVQPGCEAAPLAGGDEPVTVEYAVDGASAVRVTLVVVSEGAELLVLFAAGEDGEEMVVPCAGIVNGAALADGRGAAAVLTMEAASLSERIRQVVGRVGRIRRPVEAKKEAVVVETGGDRRPDRFVMTTTGE